LVTQHLNEIYLLDPTGNARNALIKRFGVLRKTNSSLCLRLYTTRWSSSTHTHRELFNQLLEFVESDTKKDELKVIFSKIEEERKNDPFIDKYSINLKGEVTGFP